MEQMWRKKPKYVPHGEGVGSHSVSVSVCLLIHPVNRSWIILDAIIITLIQWLRYLPQIVSKVCGRTNSAGLRLRKQVEEKYFNPFHKIHDGP